MSQTRKIPLIHGLLVRTPEGCSLNNVEKVNTKVNPILDVPQKVQQQASKESNSRTSNLIADQTKDQY